MYKPRPIWQELPHHFKISLVGKLDYKSRCCLRKVAREEKALVDECPVSIEMITLEPPVGPSDSTAQLVMLEGDSMGDGYGFPIFDRYDQSGVIFDAVLPLVHRKSVVNEVNFRRASRSFFQPEVTLGFFRKLMTEIRKHPGFKFRSKKMSWEWRGDTGTEFFEMLQLFEPSVLRTLEVDEISEACRKEVLASEHWSNLKLLYMSERHSIPIDHFLHIDKILIDLFEILPNDVWKLIQSALARNLPLGSYFCIDTLRPLDINGILETFNVMPRHEPIDFRDGGHVQRFPMPTRTHVLCVLFANETNSTHGRIKGIVCRREHVAEDFSIDPPYVF